MTVIVKPKAGPASTSDEEIQRWLTELLGDVSWPQFEATNSGDLTLLGTKFSMRIGLFMGMPTQAILAAGSFVVMKARPDLDKGMLRTIIAENVDSCLYDGSPRWKPQTTSPLDQSIQQAMEEYKMAIQHQDSPQKIDYLRVRLEHFERQKLEQEVQRSPFRYPDRSMWHGKIFE